jgi:spermidine/putrescine transport system permease protein
VGRNLFMAMAAMPLVIPTVVLGVGLLIGFAQIGVPLSLWTVALGHTVINIPEVILIVAVRLIGMEPNLEEAAMDLGATYWKTQWRVTLPLAFPAIIAAFLTSFTTSFDEFPLTFFLIGAQPTLPVYLYSQLRFPNRLPLVVAMASLIIVGSASLILLIEWLRRLGQPSISPQEVTE